MTKTQTVVVRLFHEFDHAIEQATNHLERDGTHEVFATQTHVTWCSGEAGGEMQYTAIVFARPRR